MIGRSIPIILVMTLCSSYALQGQNIFRTACSGNIDRLDSLLQQSPINIQDSRDRSLLHWAVGCRQQEVFDYLINNGIDINMEDIEGRTPMHVAVRVNSEDSFDALVDLQENNSWIDRYGASLLERAVLNENETFIQKLVHTGIDINATNSRGSTALEIAGRIKADKITELLLSLGADINRVRNVVMKGDYFGERPPKSTSKLFAPNFISTEESEFGCVFSEDGTEFYYAVDVNGKNEIRYTRMENDVWSLPEILLSHEKYGYNDPFLSPDEQRLYFISKRALDGVGDLKDVDIWYVEKTGETWSEPINAGNNINTAGNEYYISFTEDGTMYFSSNGHASEESDNENFDIYFSRFLNGDFQKPVRLGKAVNSDDYEADVFVSPDESYLIFCSSRAGGFGQGDLYISFKAPDGSWTDAINMGPGVNTRHYEYCPFVSKDGQFLFFTSRQDIYWISTDIIEKLRNDQISNRK